MMQPFDVYSSENVLFSDDELNAIEYAQYIVNDPTDDLFTEIEIQYYKELANEALSRVIEFYKQKIDNVDTNDDMYDDYMYFYNQFVACINRINNI